MLPRPTFCCTYRECTTEFPTQFKDFPLQCPPTLLSKLVGIISIQWGHDLSKSIEIHYHHSQPPNWLTGKAGTRASLLNPVCVVKRLSSRPPHSILSPNNCGVESTMPHEEYGPESPHGVYGDVCSSLVASCDLKLLKPATTLEGVDQWSLRHKAEQLPCSPLGQLWSAGKWHSAFCHWITGANLGDPSCKLWGHPT